MRSLCGHTPAPIKCSKLVIVAICFLDVTQRCWVPYERYSGRLTTAPHTTKDVVCPTYILTNQLFLRASKRNKGPRNDSRNTLSFIERFMVHTPGLLCEFLNQI